MSERLKVAIVANEFGDAASGRMGGFGWAAREAARVFVERPELGVEPVFFACEGRADGDAPERRVHGVPIIERPPSRLAHARRVRAERPDLLLLIDYRPGYRLPLLALPRTPAIVWVRDPRPPEDVRRIASLRVPGEPDRPASGVGEVDCTSLATVARLSRIAGRPLALASPAPFLAEKVRGTYGVDVDRLEMLPNPVPLLRGAPRKDERPLVVFLGRLDPYKRPWLLVELARRLPEVRFAALGQPHFRGPGGWEPPAAPPANLRFEGNVDGAEKAGRLERAWALVNTSIHEGLAVSFLEALAHETPLVSLVDPGGVVSRFGLHPGRFDGTGEAGLPALEAALRRLVDDAELRARLGREGRRWVEETHGEERFVTAFLALAARLGVRLAA